MMLAPLIYLPNDEMQTTVDAVRSFVIWSESLLISLNAPETHLKKYPSPKTKSPAHSSTSEACQMRTTKTQNNLMMLYKVVKKQKGDYRLFKFQLSGKLLGQEMECIIDAGDVVQFTTMRGISANCIAVYIKYLSEQFSNPRLKFHYPNRTVSILSLDEKITYCSARFIEVISQCSNNYILTPMNIG